MNVFDLVATLRLDSKAYEQGLVDTKTRTKRDLTAVGKFAGSALKTVSKVTMAAVTAAGAGIVAITKSAIQASTEFETAFAKLATIADTSGAEGSASIAELKTQLMELSNVSGVAMKDLAEAAYQAISAGQSTAEAVGFVETANKLAKAGFADTATATDTLTTVLNAYGEQSGLTAEKVSDLLLTTQNMGKTTVAELGSAMGRVIPTAAMYGVSMEQLASAYVTTTKNGIATAESTTYINGMLNELGKSGTTAANVLKDKTDKSFSELMASGYSLTDVLGILQEEAKESGLSMADMFGSQEAAKAAATLIQHVEDFTGAMDGMQNSMGATESAYGKMMDTFATRMQTIKTQWQNLLVSMANGSGDIGAQIDAFVESITTTLQKDIVPMMQNVFKGLSKLIVTLSPIIAQNLPALLQTLLPSLLKAAIELISALAANLPMILQILVQALIDNFPLILEAIMTLGQGLLELAVALLLSVQDAINGWFADVGAKVDAWFQGIGDKISEFIARVREKASEFIQAGVEMITGFIQSLYHGFLSLLTSVGEWVQANIIQPIKDKVGGMLEAGQDLVARVKEGLQDGFSGLLTAVGGWVNDYIIQPIKNKATEMYNVGKDIINRLWDGLKEAWNSVKSWWDSLTFSIKKATVIVDKPAGASEHAGGLEYVPYNDYPALLHVGEMVLTKNQADNYRAGNREGGNGITIVQNISATPQTPVDFAAATAAYFEQARWALI